MLNTFLRNVVATVAACSTASFFWMDCQPSLYLYDKFISKNAVLPSNQNIWIIGASSGIGRALAVELAKRSGCNSRLILSARSEQALQETAMQCQTENPSCTVQILPVDVEDSQALLQATEQIKLESFPDVVVLNAGQGHLSPACETSPDTAERMLRVNSLWPMILVPALYQDESKKKPRLIVTCSIGARLPLPVSALYSASKHAMLGYFYSLSCERPDLSIDLVCPGSTETNFHGAINNNGSSKSPSPFKMSAHRCAKLMVSAHMQRKHGSTGLREIWITKQPTLATAYLHLFSPQLAQMLLTRIGTKRLQMWKDGLDLYDPESWRSGPKERDK